MTAVRSGFALVMGLLAAASTPVPAAAQQGSGCASPEHPGGDWPSLNHDLHNTRHQDREDEIDVARARGLQPVWRFNLPEGTDLRKETYGLQSTPIVANGCVYVAASAEETAVSKLMDPLPTDWRGGIVFALNADSGKEVWRTAVNGFVVGLAATHGLIYAYPSAAAKSARPSGVQEPPGAHAVALDAATGKMVWSSEQLDSSDQAAGSVAVASPVVIPNKSLSRSLLFVPLSVGYGDGTRVPLYFLDARSGKVVAKFFALSDSDYQEGYGGVGIWTTAAFDEATNHLYAGTADSEGHRFQHARNNAILKIDADRSRKTFASVVDEYTATPEQYVEQLPTTNPVCELPQRQLLSTDPSASVACLEQDLDFGSSPNLFVHSTHGTVVAALQKSGVLHVVETQGMTAIRTPILSPPHQISNAATGTIDGERLYVRAFPDSLFSFARESGDLEWASNAGGSAFAYQPLTLANGVIYAITDAGELAMFDAGSGLPIARKPIAVDAGVPSCYGWGAGVTVARHMVYVPCDADAGLFLPGTTGALVAYKAPG